MFESETDMSKRTQSAWPFLAASLRGTGGNGSSSKASERKFRICLKRERSPDRAAASSCRVISFRVGTGVMGDGEKLLDCHHHTAK